MCQAISINSLIVLFLVGSLQITHLAECSPTQGQGSSGPCESSNSADCTSASPPPVAQLCRAQQGEFDHSTKEKYNEKCDLDKATRKNGDGTLEQSDIVNCYRPQCDYISGNYLAKQCSYHFRDWCWCSSPDGYAIPGTFQKNMPEGTCINQPKCEVDGTLHNVGDVFARFNICGLCECHSNLSHTCFIEYTVDADGRLSNDQVEILKKDMIQAFKLQYDHNDHVPVTAVDIKQTYKMPSEVSDSLKVMILSWKFKYYNRNGDDVLSPIEEFIFHDELTTFFVCSDYFDHLSELVDNNKDNEISLQEWYAFFGVAIISDGDLSRERPTQLVAQKREAPLFDVPKPLHLRKKFKYYVIA